MKFERQNADFDYNRLVVISDLSPQRDVDTQLALLAGNPTSETAIALSASIDGRAPAFWQPSTVVTAGTVRTAPDGSVISRNADGTTRSSFDPTEQAAWTVIISKAGTLAQVALSGSYGYELKSTLTDATFDTFLAGLPSGARVFIPHGVTISLAASHTLTKPVTIDGPGRILDTRTSPTSELFRIGPAASGTRITCAIDGSLTATYQALHNAIYIVGTDNGAGVAPTFVTDVVIDSPRISGFGRFAVRGLFVKDALINIGNAGNLGHGGVLIESGDTCDAKIGVLHNVTPGPGPGTEVYGIQFGRTDTTSDTVRYPLAKNCFGRIDVARDAPLMNMLGTHGGQGCAFSFGAAYGIKRVIDIVSATGDADTAAFAPNDCTFYGGYANSGVTDGSMDSAVVLAGAYASSAVVEYAKGISGHIDTLVGYGVESDSINGAVYCRTTLGMSISFGTIREPSPRAIHLYHTNQDFEVAVGTVVDAWSNTLSDADFVGCVGTTNKGIISRLFGSRGSKSATKVNTRGVYSQVNAATQIRLGASVDLKAATTRVVGNVSGLFQYDVSQLGVVIDGTLLALFYAGNLLMSASTKITAAASVAGTAGFRITSGSADPTSPAIGDIWVRSASLKANIGGVNRTILGNVVAKSANYTLTTDDRTCLATGGASGITITLPAATLGARYEIKKVDSGAGAITVATTSSQTIDGATTKSLAAQWDKITVTSDGTSWFAI